MWSTNLSLFIYSIRCFQDQIADKCIDSFRFPVLYMRGGGGEGLTTEYI